MNATGSIECIHGLLERNQFSHLVSLYVLVIWDALSKCCYLDKHEKSRFSKSFQPLFLVTLMTFLHMVYAYQSRNQRSLLRKEINYLIEKYKRNKETKKLQFEIEELRRLRKVFIMMLIALVMRKRLILQSLLDNQSVFNTKSHELEPIALNPFKEQVKSMQIRIRSRSRP